MTRFAKWFTKNPVPTVSGALILLSLAVGRIAGGAADLTLTPRWWLDAGDHNLDQLAEHYRLTPAQALRAVMRRESLAAQVTA